MALFGEQRSRARDWEATTAPPVMADHEGLPISTRMRKAPIGRGLRSELKGGIARPGICHSAESRSTPACSFWGYLRVDLAENRFVLLLFPPALAIPENPMQNVRPTDLAPAAEHVSPVSDGVNRVITVAPAPLLPGEKQADYADVAVRVVRAAKPRDAIEEFLIRDVIDLTWEILRLRRVKSGLLKASMNAGVGEILKGLGHGPRSALFYAQNLGEKWAAGDKEARKEVEAALAKAGLTIDEVTAKTLEKKLDSFERLDRMLASAEARRNNALREIDRHRDALGGGVRRSIEEIEDAEFRDVETGKAAAGAES